MTAKLDTAHPKVFFLKQITSGELDCFKTVEGHESCREYKGWCTGHPIDAKELISKANKSCKSVYIPMACLVPCPRVGDRAAPYLDLRNLCRSMVV